MKIELVPYSPLFLDLSWKWLNDPEIYQLTNTSAFSKMHQKNWFNSLVYKKNYKIWGINYDQIPIGACGLKNITVNDCEYWGYIGEKKYWGLGIGTTVLNLLLDYAKSQNKITVWLSVLNHNEKAMNLYSKRGFQVESVEKNNLIKMRIKL